MDKYKIECMDYIYNWIDVGPGPRERGGTIGIYPITRNYRKTFTDLKLVFEKVKELQSRKYKFDIIIISKLQNNQYIPGKLTIGIYKEATWKALAGFEWKRENLRLPIFSLYYNSKPSIPHSGVFIEIKPTLLEVMNDVEPYYNRKNVINSIMDNMSHIFIAFNTIKGRRKNSYGCTNI